MLLALLTLLLTFMAQGAVLAGDAPAELFELKAAQALRALPQAELALADGELSVSFPDGLPEGAALSVLFPDGTSAALTADGGRYLAACPGAARCFVDLCWTADGDEYTVRYMAAGGAGMVWSASVRTGGSLVTLGSGGGYTLKTVLPGTDEALSYYTADGALTGSLVRGDRRQAGSLPLTISYDLYGRAVEITALDTADSYRWHRALGKWQSSGGADAPANGLPDFDPALHEAPAAVSLTVGAVFQSEKDLAVDRAQLLAAAPALTALTVEDACVRLTASALGRAEVLVDDEMRYSTDQGTVVRQGDELIVYSDFIYPDSRIRVTLTVGALTAVYQGTALQTVTDRAAGATLSVPDGTLSVRSGAVTAYYTKRGQLSSCTVEAPDGALLTYNARGRLTGVELEGYIWGQKEGWRTTAVNEKGNVIHPSVKKPGNIDIDSYPQSIALR